jgi:hypothetical protein
MLKIFIAVLYFFMTEPVSATGSEKNPPKIVPVKEEMAGLYYTVSNLLPLVLNKADFENKKNAKKIARQMNALATLTKKMASNTTRFADSDPSIGYISAQFAGDISYAIGMWNKGDRIVPRRILRNVTDYCISCHTRTGKGLHFGQANQSLAFKSMPTINKAEYLLATRQFEEALKAYEIILIDTSIAKINPEGWSTAVKKLLAVTIRVKNDPFLTLEMISRIQDNPDSMPPALQADVAEWRRGAKSWLDEKKSTSENDDQKYSAVVRLMKEADAAVLVTPGGALVQHMRASTILHEVLGRVRGGRHYQEMFWRAGESANYLRNFNLWTLQDIYYEQCVRVGGDIALSKTCLKALEASMVTSYGVASKSGLPEFLKVRLESLKADLE